MRLQSPFLALAALASCHSLPGLQGGAAGSSPASVPEQQLTLYLGQRSLSDDTFWTPNEDQTVGALEYSRENRADVVGWEVGIAGSSDASSDAVGNAWKGSTAEFYGGVRKSWGDGAIRPYVGAGLSYIAAEWELFGQTDDDSSMAGYLHGGLQWLVSPAVCIGFDLRTLFGSSLSLGQNTTGGDFAGDADYVQAALSVGWRF